MNDSTSSEKSSLTVLITGANRGLGLEFCRQYVAAGHQVIAACRQPHKAAELTELSEQASLAVMALDVSDPEAIERFGSQFSSQPIDLLINNAGIYGSQGQVIGNCHTEAWLQTFQVNSVAPMLVATALLPSLKLARQPKIGFLSSKMGSMGDNSSGGSYIYRSSKAALNAIVKSMAIDFAQVISMVALHPGWVRTDMGGPDGLIDSVESVKGMRQVLTDLSFENSGQFVDYKGKQVPW